MKIRIREKNIFSYVQVVQKEECMKKIHEVSEMAGVSKRTLQYYDDCGLLVTKR